MRVEKVKTNLTNNNAPYLYWLYAIEGIGSKTLDILIKEFGDARHIYSASEDDIKPYLNTKQQLFFHKAKAEQIPEQMYETLLSKDIRFVPRESAEYPQKLRVIPDAPYTLYVKGSLPDPAVPTVAVIGARLCSEYGRYMARVFGQELASRGCQVISGMATGIDGIAEKAAIAAGGSAFSVLGSGVDVCYPPENLDLFELCLKKGGLISEYVPGTMPRAALFPPRNRIISGLADAVLVIEARAKSGTLITVDMALEQGKEVYVLPGRVTDRLSDGCNCLLKQGALIATCADDICDSLTFRDKNKREQSAGAVRTTQVSVSSATSDSGAHEENEALPGGVIAAVLYMLELSPRSVADIEEQLVKQGISITPSELMCTLVDLELAGRVYREGGMYVCRKVKNMQAI